MAWSQLDPLEPLPAFSACRGIIIPASGAHTCASSNIAPSDTATLLLKIADKALSGAPCRRWDAASPAATPACMSTLVSR